MYNQRWGMSIVIPVLDSLLTEITQNITVALCHGKAFRITDPLRGNPPLDDGRFPLQRAKNAGLGCILCCQAEQAIEQTVNSSVILEIVTFMWLLLRFDTFHTGSWILHTNLNNTMCADGMSADVARVSTGIKCNWRTLSFLEGIFFHLPVSDQCSGLKLQNAGVLWICVAEWCLNGGP